MMTEFDQLRSGTVDRRERNHCAKRLTETGAEMSHPHYPPAPNLPVFLDFRKAIRGPPRRTSGPDNGVALLSLTMVKASIAII
jgi:hypothetical protein